MATPFVKDFDINKQTDEGSARAERNHDIGNHRLTEAITRLVNDRKVRSANKLLHSISDGKEISFELKKNTFQEKLPRDDSEPPTYPRVNVPMFSDEEILNATKSLNRQAATAIDGYTKDLLLQAFEQDASIISLFGTLIHWILKTNMSHTIRRILLLNRGVAIPKMDGGVRPICVSSTLLKIIGVIAMKRDGAPPSAIQMAIGVK